MQLGNTGLSNHYHKLWQESLQKIKESGFEFDPFLGLESDDRFGITLLIRPNQQIKSALQQFIQTIKQIEPDQHYYPNSDIHLTVMPIISSYSGFQLNQIELPLYHSLLLNCMKSIKCFSVHFCGITVSPSCIMVKGFPSDESLNLVRERLRLAFKNSTLEQSLDKRYPIQTAHSTVIRFKNPVGKSNQILAKIDQFKDFDFGKFHVDQMELVFNDWYQREKFVKTLYIYHLE